MLQCNSHCKGAILLKWILVAVFSMCLAACAGPMSAAPSGADAYQLLEKSGPPADTEYRIGPFDLLSINVFQEPDLTFEAVPVDSSGSIPFPLIGTVKVGGLTSSEVSSDIEQRLKVRDFVVNPQVTIFIAKSASQKITIEGDVKKPGIFEVQGKMTLLQAMALAEGPNRTARLGEIIIIRKTGEDIYAAQFDLRNIRAFKEPNPVLQGEDIVVVGRSGLKALYEDLLKLSPPLTAIFVQILRN